MENFINRYGGAKRLRYQRAADDLRVFGLSDRDYKLSMFVKNENILVPKKVNPDPRPIQFRSFKFNVAISQFLKPIEEALYHLKLHDSLSTGTRVIAKGLNMRGRAKLIQLKLSKFKNPAIISIDGKRFDLHVNVDLLQYEHKVYSFYNQDPAFMSLLRRQIKNSGSSKEGLSYELNGGRMSGDMNTGLGNCVISLLMFLAWREVFKHKADVIIDGDDTVIFVEKEFEKEATDSIPSTYLEYGMEMSVEPTVYAIEDISWCQTNPVSIHGKYKMVREPRRVLSHLLVGKKWQFHRQKDLLSAIAQCEMALNYGVPILQNAAMALWRSSNKNWKLLESEYREPIIQRGMAEEAFKQVKKHGMRTRECDLDTRISFARAFGISVSEQVSWESYLDLWTCPTGVPTPVGVPIDTDWFYTSCVPLG
jgi:hypothetical protein